MCLVGEKIKTYKSYLKSIKKKLNDEVENWGKKIKTYKSYLESIKKKLNDDVENCGSFKSFGFIYI